MAKYDEPLKLPVVQSYESGEQGFKAVALVHGFDHATVRRWVKGAQHFSDGIRFTRVCKTGDEYV